MREALGLIRRCHRLGIRLRADRGAVVFRPASRASMDLVECLRQAKPELLDLLKRPAPEPPEPGTVNHAAVELVGYVPVALRPERFEMWRERVEGFSDYGAMSRSDAELTTRDVLGWAPPDWQPPVPLAGKTTASSAPPDIGEQAASWDWSEAIQRADETERDRLQV